MNILLWVLQFLLAAHTAIGAVWKFSNPPAATMPSLAAIPGGVWLAMSIVELACVVALVVSIVHRPLAGLVPLAAIVIAVEMLVFCALHLASGDAGLGPFAYWLVVAAFCAFIAYGRLVMNPL